MSNALAALLRRAPAALAEALGGRTLSSAPAALAAAGKGKAAAGGAAPKKSPAAAALEDDDTFELLPPGCSMVDPAYGTDAETVVFYDSKQDGGAAAAAAPPARGSGGSSERPRSRPGSVTTSDGRVEYVPPGSSMREPGDPTK
jgi:hypothetical protein